MIKFQRAFEKLSADEYRKLLDAPVWLALLAAFSNDGRISPAEERGAIRLTHLRSFSAPKSIRPLYEAINERFPKRFRKLRDRLPTGRQNKLIYLKAQVKDALTVLDKLDPDVAESLQENFESFYRHIFNTDKGFFHYFALPVFSSHVEKKYVNKKKPETAA